MAALVAVLSVHLPFLVPQLTLCRAADYAEDDNVDRWRRQNAGNSLAGRSIRVRLLEIKASALPLCCHDTLCQP